MIEQPFAIKDNVFEYVDTETNESRFTQATLRVPKGKKALYAATDGWKNFQEIEEMGSSPTPDPTDPDTDISQLSNVIYVDNVTASAGSQLTLSVKMKNEAAIRGFQFNLVLPQGVTVAKNNKGRILASLSDQRREADDEHTLTAAEQADGSILFLCGSLYDETFTGNDGEVLTVTVDIAESMADGDYPIVLKNIKMTETDISKSYETEEVMRTLTISSFVPGDIDGNKVVDVSDYIGVANYILGIPQENFNERAADVAGPDARDAAGRRIIDVSDYIGVANIILTGSANGNSRAVMSVTRRGPVE
mgnify:CR=1 FL=1